MGGGGAHRSVRVSEGRSDGMSSSESSESGGFGGGMLAVGMFLMEGGFVARL